jgi:hypothetical protein
MGIAFLVENEETPFVCIFSCSSKKTNEISHCDNEMSKESTEAFFYLLESMSHLHCSMKKRRDDQHRSFKSHLSSKRIQCVVSHLLTSSLVPRKYIKVKIPSLSISSVSCCSIFCSNKFTFRALFRFISLFYLLSIRFCRPPDEIRESRHLSDLFSLSIMLRDMFA